MTITLPNACCSAASFEFLSSFASAGDFFRAVEALTEQLAASADDVTAQMANTIEKCRLCGIWSTTTDNDHILIEDNWHTACPVCLWKAFECATLHVDREMKSTRFVPANNEEK